MAHRLTDSAKRIDRLEERLKDLEDKVRELSALPVTKAKSRKLDPKVESPRKWRLSPPDIAKLWSSEIEGEWLDALRYYQNYLKPANQELENRMSVLDPDRVRALDPKAWFDFLHNEYFVWRNTQPNRLKTTRKALSTYESEDNLAGLFELKERSHFSIGVFVKNISEIVSAA
jgi:hypothetical protein